MSLTLSAMIDIAKIKQLREKLGLTQQEAAEKAGLATRQAWHSIESGRQPNLGVLMLEKVAKVLGARAKDLLK